jgi:hypothetical protein
MANTSLISGSAGAKVSAKNATQKSSTGVRGKKKAAQTLEFRHHLVLNQWLLSLFGFDAVSGRYPVGKQFGSNKPHEAATLEAFRDRFQLKGDVTGRDDEGVHYVLKNILQNYETSPGMSGTGADAVHKVKLTEEQLLDYDRNIKKLTDKINEGRQNAGETALEWKYFQYLALLFTEVYLDYLFNRREQLLTELNEQITRWNTYWIDEQDFKHKALERLNPEDDYWPQLSRIAFWNATGSGKTLLMHANIHQFRHYLKRFGKPNAINHIVLLTPNEGLTRQHLQELQTSGIVAAEFTSRAVSQQGDMLYAQNPVLVIDINKLRESENKKTVAVGSFGTNNLLLVDEGHRGTASGGGTWLEYRQKLCETGFSIEYSATFAQAAMQHDSLRQVYTKSILFDYSYRHFYSDGYGKQSQILNLEGSKDKDDEFRYLVASLLSYYQQLRLFDAHPEQFRRFNLARPLWIFVSSKVTATLNTGEASDMVKVLQFVEQVLTKPQDTIAVIDQLLKRGMETSGGRNLLDGRFNFLKGSGFEAADIHADLLERIFHCNGGHLHIENIAGVKGEIALFGGTSDKPFGVINVGDDTKLLKLCEQNDLMVRDARFAESRFNTINNDDSDINVLIGSKKFTEGWSSWRVSNMTLMNVGKNEGAQIIQLFGRGVRLKGFATTLKRSAELPELLRAAGVERPEYIGILETLNIFGLQADYIAQFRKELEDEEIPINEGLIEYELPIVPMDNLPQDLPIIRLQSNIAGKAIGGSGTAFLELAEQVVLESPMQLRNRGEQGAFEYFCHPPRVQLDYYPRVGAFSTDKQGERDVARKTQTLGEIHRALINTEALYFDLLAFKREKRWSNLTITREVVEKLLEDSGWYELEAPDLSMDVGDLNKIALWQEMAGSLLRKYCQMFYTYSRKKWEANKLEYRPITENNQYLFGKQEAGQCGSYTLTLDSFRHDDLIKELDLIRQSILDGDVTAWRDKEPGSRLMMLWCERHLYQPLVAATQGLDFQISPVALNSGEANFVKDLQQAWEQGIFSGCDLYVLRNQTGQGAVGVFIDGGFQPDFILWIRKGDKQHVVFVDPKGLGRLRPHSPKVQFYKTIKEIEADMVRQYPSYANVQLDAFLYSVTRKGALLSDWTEYEGQTVTEQHLQDWNILFEEEGVQAVEQMFKTVM